MAISLGTLVIDLQAGTATLQTGLAKAEQLSLASAKKMEQSFMIVAGAAAAATTAIVGMGLALMESAIKGGAELEKMSEITGATVESLQVMKRTAGDLGIEFEGVEKSMTKMAKSMAASDPSKAGDAYTRLGLSVRDASGQFKTTDVMMQEVAAKLAGMSDLTERAALAQKIFGKAGAENIPVLLKLAESYKQTQTALSIHGALFTPEDTKRSQDFERNLKQLENTGMIVANVLAKQFLPALVDLSGWMLKMRDTSDLLHDSVIAIGTGFRTAAELAVDLYTGARLAAQALTDLYNVKTGNFAQLGIDHAAGSYSKILSDQATALAAIHKAGDPGTPPGGKKGNPLPPKQTDDQADKIDKTIARLREQVATFGLNSVAIELYKGKIDGANASQLALIGTLATQMESLKANADLDKQIAAVKQQMNDIGKDELALFTESLGKMNSEHPAKAEELVDAEAALIKKKEQVAIDAVLKTSTDAYANSLMTAGDLIEKQISSMKGMTAEKEQDILLNNMLTATQGLGAAAFEKWNAEQAASSAEMAKLGAQIRNDLLTPYDLLVQELEKVDKALEAGTITAETAGMAQAKAANTYNAAIEQKSIPLTKDFTKNMELLAKSVADGFTNAIINGKGFSGVLQGLVKDLEKMAIQMAVMQPLFGFLKGLGGEGSIWSVIFGGGKATGGDVSGGTSYLVGENGPELFTPGSSGNITPNNMLRSGGASSPQIYIDARGTDAAAIYANVRRAITDSAQQSALAAILGGAEIQLRRA